MYIKKDKLIDAYKIEYEHYYKNTSFIKIIIKIIKDNINFFLNFSKKEDVKLKISNFDYILLSFNKNIQKQMSQSIDMIFNKKKICILKFDSKRNITSNNDFKSYDLSSYININKREVFFNFIGCLFNVLRFLSKKILKDELFYNCNKLFYSKIFALSKIINIGENIKIINFDDADSKIRILNQSIFLNHKKISIQQGLILENSIEYYYPSSDIFIVYGDYFKNKLINFFKFKKKIISMGVFELICNSNHDLENSNQNKYEYTYISQPYVKSLFKNYYDKIRLDNKISLLFFDQIIYKKFHPFEGKLTSILNSIFHKNFRSIDEPIIQLIKKSHNLITLSSTAAFYGILFKKNIIVIKYKYSNYFDNFLESKLIKFKNASEYKMIYSADNLVISYFFSGDLIHQKDNFLSYFNE